MNLKEVDKPEVKKTIVVYSGRFQPFHRGHNVAYQKLVSKFGANNVYIGTSDKTDGGKSPFNFSEKKTIMQKMFGIPSNKIVQVSNPYAPKEILSKFDGKTTAYIAAVGEKDATRLAGKYFKPYNDKTGYGYDEIGYTYIIPAEKNPISGTDVRNGLGNADIEKSKSFFLKAYPKFDKDIFNMIKSKLNEEGLPGGIGVGLNLPNGYINGAPTGSMDELYDPINELLGRVAAEEIFNEWLESYLGEAPNPIMDKEITYNSADGKKKKITVRGALRLPKDHEAHIQAKKMVGPDDAPANEPKKKAETPPQPGQPVKKGDTAQGKVDAKPKDGAAGTEKQAPPPEQKLSGAELKSSAEMTDADRYAQRVEQVLDKAKKSLSKEDNESIDKVNNPQSEERKGAINTLKKVASYLQHGVEHVIQHNKEMMVGSGRAIKSLATTGRFGAVKDKNGKNVHWDDFTEEDENTKGLKDFQGKPNPKMKDVPVYKTDKHGHPIKDKDGNKIQEKNWLGKPKTKKEPVYREDLTSEQRELAEKSWKESQRQKSGLKNLAKTSALIMGSIAVTGGLIGGGAAAMKGASVSGIAQGATAKIAAKFGGGHLGSYILKDVIKHSAFEALGASAGQATVGGIALGVAGIFENKNGEEEFDTKKFVPNFIEKTLEIMENYKLSNEQLIQTLAEYKKEGTTNQSMANARDLMKENLSETKQQSIQHFVEFATKRLKLKENPQINLVGGKEYGNVKSSLGGYNPIDKTIYVATEGRLTADILRTIAHEMVHRKQDELGLIKNEVKDGADGSPIENQAHAVAGILMREYGRINKQIYNEDVNVDVDKGDEVLMGKFKNKKVTVKDIGKDSHGMPTINGKQATTFRTVNEINKGFFKGKIKIGGQPVDVEVELVGADNKNREFVTKVIDIDKKYQSKLPIGSTLPIPARLFRHGGWVKVKTPSAFNERIDGDTYNADSEGEEDFTKHHATSMYAPDMGYGAEPDTYDFDDLKDTKPGYQTPSQDKDVEDRGYEPVKKNSKIHEVSNVNTANTADVPDGAFIKKGKKRTLDTDKSESWYANGGYTQTDFPKADAIFGDDDAEERTIKYTIKNLPDVQFTPTEFIKEENITEVAARYVEPKRVEAFLNKYPKVEDLMQKIVDKVKDVDRGYQIFLHYKDDKGQERYFGGKKDTKSKSTNVKGLGRTALNKTGKSFNSKTTYNYEWNGKIDTPIWGELFQYVWNKKYDSLNEGLSKQIINEVQWEDSAYDKCMLGKLPLSLNIIKKIVEPIRTTSLHATDVEHLPQVDALQGKQKSISTFTKTTKWGKLVQGKGMHTKGGIIVALSGVVLAQSIMDLWTEPDKKGMRWVNPGTIIAGLGREQDVVFNFAPELKPYKEDWKKNMYDNPATNKEKAEFIAKYIDAADRYMLSKKKEFQDKYLNSNGLYYDSDWNEVVLNQIKIESILVVPELLKVKTQVGSWTFDREDKDETDKIIKQLKQKYKNVVVAKNEADISNFITTNGGSIINESINQSKELIMEGGAYGHMNHPFDISMNLTFGDLKKIINNALDGKLGVVREKTDGQALAISWKNGKLIAARNKGHLANGGSNALDMNALASKFGGRGALSDAYNFAMQDLSAAISGLGEKERQSIFKDGSAFCNLEVIYPENANVIPYGQSLLIFHNVVEYDEKGNAVGAVKGAESKLASLIKQTNAHVQSKYTLQGPPITKLPKDEKLSSQKSKFNGMLSRLQSEFGLSDKDGVAEYHYAWWMNFINKSKKNLAQLEKEGLARRWAFDNKSFPIKSITDEDARKWADGVDKDAKDKIMKGNLRKFEDIFLGVGAEVLSFMSSVLTAQPDKALQSIKASLESSISDIRNGGSEAQIKRLEKELARLNAIGGFEKLVPNEGLVFFYKGNTYKLTGTFAPLNQILGIFKFGR